VLNENLVINLNMSRVGKKIISIPAGVTITAAPELVTVKGPQGTLSRPWPAAFKLEVEGSEARVTPLGPKSAAWGTTVAHLRNMTVGVTEGFTKKLQFEGVGYRAAVSGSNVVLNLGFSHPVTMAIPADVKVVVEKNNMTITGPSAETVGQFAANIRAHKPPEPYKGKGIRYAAEVVRRKAGKKVTSA
jgi:large subunit ribosomal protein L6